MEGPVTENVLHTEKTEGSVKQLENNIWRQCFANRASAIPMFQKLCLSYQR
jgi:hypothetical protein